MLCVQDLIFVVIYLRLLALLMFFLKVLIRVGAAPCLLLYEVHFSGEGVVLDFRDLMHLEFALR